MAAEYISLAVENVKAVIAEFLPGELAALPVPRDMFTSIGKTFRGLLYNPPECWIMPARTQLGDEGQGEDEAHTLTVKMGLAGASDPDELMDLAMDYARAVTRALAAAGPEKWRPEVLKVYVMEHDYGPVFQKDGGFAVFPNVHILVAMQEVG